MTGVINWGGNIGSLLNALKAVGASYRLVDDPDQMNQVGRIIFPGVGNFGTVMHILRERELYTPIVKALEQGKPYLGICIGMQILFDISEEAPGTRGLGLIKGRCRLFRTRKVPQIGFNRVHTSNKILEDGGFYYFINSYYCEPEEDVCVATAEYGVIFCAAVKKGNIFGVQFHPERSAETGLRFLRRWLDAH